MRKLKLYACTLLGTVLTAYGLMGCGNTVDCDINYDHAHVYTGQSGITRYIESERETIDGLSRTDEAKSLNPQEEKLLKFLNKNKLYLIKDNKEYLESIMEITKPHTEYEYTYMAHVIDHYLDGRSGMITYSSIGMKTRTDSDGDTHVETYPNYPVYEDVERTDFTTDTSCETLTGQARDVTYKYNTYRVIMDSDGKYSLEKSAPINDPYDLEYTYKYFKEEDLYIPDYGPKYEVGNIKN